MADLYRKISMDNISSPDRLDKMLRVAYPSTWMVIFAGVILTIGLLTWSFMGKITKTYHAEGITKNGNEIVCYIPYSEINQIKKGNQAYVTVKDQEYCAKVISVEEHNVSFEEMENELPNKEMAQHFFSSDLLLMRVKLRVSEEEIGNENLVDVTFQTESHRPIDVFQKAIK